MVYKEVFTFNPFQENTYLLWDDAGNGVIFDPGCHNYEERKVLTDFILSKDIQLKYCLNTHAHIDHVLGVHYIKEQYKVPFGLHPKDLPLLNDAANRAAVYGFPAYQSVEVDRLLEDNEIIEIGEMKLKVLFVPGHAPGHVAFYLEEQGWLIDGDVLFRRSIGRTDFPLCNHADLVNSIQNQLYVLPEETEVFPGHGGSTTIGIEKNQNPFVRA